MKTKQLLKTFNGYVVTYHYYRKCNRFVITQHGRVVTSFADWHSCLYFIYEETGNFEVMRND